MPRDLKPIYVHPSQLPPSIAATVNGVATALDAEDRQLEAAILAPLRAARLQSRINVMADALRAQHHDLSVRDVFRILEVTSGFSRSHVSRVYYRGRPSCSR